jgi:hypothetical protein
VKRIFTNGEIMPIEMPLVIAKTHHERGGGQKVSPVGTEVTGGVLERRFAAARGIGHPVPTR